MTLFAISCFPSNSQQEWKGGLQTNIILESVDVTLFMSVLPSRGLIEESCFFPSYNRNINEKSTYQKRIFNYRQSNTPQTQESDIRWFVLFINSRIYLSFLTCQLSGKNIWINQLLLLWLLYMLFMIKHH